MAEELDPGTRHVLMALEECYQLLIRVCASLPILPITLPEATGPGSWQARTDAVAHASEICYEIPASSAVCDNLKCAFLYWLGAADMLILQTGNPKRYRVEAIRAILLTAEDYARDVDHLLNDK
ncbi:hypothetical protein AB0K09_15220 [Streptomyces sp. NPDC049577]|uniref:hypothetical protein n=1 Tax=Streptomyces sp. NPDC049577 TaxID=3155153 RepID=UPI003432F036